MALSRTVVAPESGNVFVNLTVELEVVANRRNPSVRFELIRIYVAPLGLRLDSVPSPTACAVVY